MKQEPTAPPTYQHSPPHQPRRTSTFGSTSSTELSSLAPASLALSEQRTTRTPVSTHPQKTADVRHNKPKLESTTKLEPSNSSSSVSTVTTLDTDLSFQAFLDSLDSLPPTSTSTVTGTSALVDYTQTAMTTDATMAAEFAELFDIGPMPLHMEDDGTNWESFLNFPAAGVADAAHSEDGEAETTHHSPAPSTESEQSQQLDPSSRGTSPAVEAESYGAISDPRASSDPTMMSTFGAFGEFGNLSDLSSLGTGPESISLLGLNMNFSLPTTDLTSGMPSHGAVEPAALFTDDKHPLAPIYSQLGWTDDVSAAVKASAETAVAAPTTVSPSVLTAVSAALGGLKRKVSDASDASAPEAVEPPRKKRGRPPKHLARTASLLGTPASVSTLALNSPSASPSPTLPAALLARTFSATSTSALLGPSSATASLLGLSTPASSLLGSSATAQTSSGKSKKPPPPPESTARPKSVVPVKYLKDNTAQSITGMTQDQILSYTSFDELLKHVAADKVAGAREFGKRLEEGRDRAADAAKRAREEKKARIYELEGEVERLQGVLRKLVSQGKVRMEDLEGM